MNNSIKLTFNKVFFIALLLIIAINVIGTFLKNGILLQAALSLFIPIFLIFYLIKYKSLRLVFTLFLVFSFLGDAALTIVSIESIVETSSILYLISYVCLILIIIPYFKLSQINKIIGTYLFVVFFIATYFLYIFYGIMDSVVANQSEVILFGIRSLMLLILLFVSFGVYLNTQSNQSRLFLTSIIFIGFSVIMSYINMYYYFNANFVLIQRILYAIGLYFTFRFFIKEQINIRTTLFRVPSNFRSKNVMV